MRSILLSTLVVVFAASPAVSEPAPTAPIPVAAAATAPEIWFVFPAEGAPLTPILLVGTDFGNGIPFFGFLPSVPLFTFQTPTLPFIGAISLMVTPVTLLPFPGVVPLKIVNGLQVSNSVDFLVL
jgi:hypothetical protein